MSETMKNSLTEQDLEKISKLLDVKLDSKLDAKLSMLEKSMKQYVNEGVEAIMEGMNAMVATIAHKNKVGRQ